MCLGFRRPSVSFLGPLAAGSRPRGSDGRVLLLTELKLFLRVSLGGARSMTPPWLLNTVELTPSSPSEPPLNQGFVASGTPSGQSSGKTYSVTFSFRFVIGADELARPNAIPFRIHQREIRML